MEKQKELCPWCLKEVWVEAARPRLYRCSSCRHSFSFTPRRREGQSERTRPAPSLERAMLPPDLMESPFLRDLLSQALTYLQEGEPAHPSNLPGSERISLALYLAHQLGCPVALVHDDMKMVTVSLVMTEGGQERSYTQNSNIHIALQTEEAMEPPWPGEALPRLSRAEMKHMLDLLRVFLGMALKEDDSSDQPTTGQEVTATAAE